MKRLLACAGVLVAAVALAQTRPGDLPARPTGDVGGPSPSVVTSLLTGLEVYYAYEGASTTPADAVAFMGYDSSVKHRFATGGAGNPTQVAGKSGNGIESGTSTTNGIFTTTTAFRQAADFTLAFWAKTNGIQACTDNGWNTNINLADEGDYKVNTLITGAPPTSLTFTAFDSVAGSAIVNSVSIDATFRLYVLVYTASSKTFTVYRDNVSIGTSAALTNALRQTGTQLNVQAPTATPQCRPVVDELAIWSVGLDATKRSCLWNGGTGGFFPFAGLCSS